MPSVVALRGKEGTVFSVFDNSSTCGWNPEGESKPVQITRASIERIQFKTTPNGTFRGLFVFGRHGERDMTSAEVKVCTDQQVSPRRTGIDFRPPTKAYRVDFKFEGERMIRVGGSPGSSK